MRPSILLNPYRTLLGALLLVALVMPVRAHSPGAEGAAGAGQATPASADPPAAGPRLTLRAGFWWVRNLLFMIAAHSAVTAGAAQPAVNSPFAFGTMPGFNLSAGDPASVLAAQGVGLALTHANGTGALPPLGDLNTLLAQYIPAGSSVLATLPEAYLQPGQGSGAAIGNPSSLSDPEASGPDLLLPAGPSDIQLESSHELLSDELSAAQSNLKATILTEAYYIQASIGLNLLAEASLFPQNAPYLSDALNFAGNELLSAGHATAAVASHVQVGAAAHVVSDLEARKAKQAARPGKAWGKGTGQSQRLDDFLDPQLIYGAWQRIETDESGRRVRYQISRTGVSMRTETPNPHGGSRVQSEVRPGAVDGFVSYDLDGLGSGMVNVTIQLTRASGQAVSRDFVYLRVNNCDPDQPQTLDVLVEQQGERHAYVRIARF